METVFTKMTENQAKLGADIYPTTNPGYTTKISYIDEVVRNLYIIIPIITYFKIFISITIL